MPAYLAHSEHDQATPFPCGAVTTIGRDPRATVALDDPRLSRQHAVIRRLARDEYYLMDLGSRNGTLVNDRRIGTPVLLQHGDRILLGSTTLLFCLGDGSGDSTDRSIYLPETLATTRDVGIVTLTALVADIRGFTNLSARLPVDLLARVMSDWFGQVQHAVERQGGELDKFMGDGVLAYWRHEHEQAPVPRGALRAAHEIARVTGAMNQCHVAMGEPLRVGAGLHTGPAGFSEGMVCTALGDTINQTFRLESATKTLGRDLVMSAACHERLAGLPNGDRQVVTLRGVPTPVTVHGYSWPDLALWLRQHPDPAGT